ncbi:UDP-N-acetylmuramoyl-tripeptide--D-alanyl-D-alanine ligase [Actinopolymorpha sp. NPDC004070]|uniref:UDP-N-acetylmuramoyl-tripeptide--D-alanyl-D- alanine ligase n=1 Tax=Actinopolymorpha sp. NPDC004070 TaxID=3154548 RepID=UPI0033B6430A
MITMTLAEIAAAVGGELHEADPDSTVTGGVAADTRKLSPRGLFVADGRGHDFAAEAVHKGAAAVLSSRPLPGLPCVVAPPAQGHRDASVAATGRLARHLLDRLPDLTLVAVTGSAGKTTTKDLLAQLLAGAGETVAPEGSLNDELGMPLTVLRADEETRYLVLEMGARGVGHIRYLTELAPPDISVVLNVGLAHVGEFGGKEMTAKAKGELVEALGEDGVAVLNADDPLVAAMAGKNRGRTVWVGEGPDATVRAEGVRLDDAGRAAFELVTPGGSAKVALGLVGRHHVANALAVAAVGLAVGLDVVAVAERLSAAVALSRWRMEVSVRSDGVTIVNDAYNANPDSMRAALETLPVLARGGRSWAVLGEMLELGEAADEAHEGVGRLAVRLGVSRLVAVGAGARAIERGARAEGYSGEESVFVPDTDQALALLRRELRAGDVVLVKSSRDAGLRHLGDTLSEDAGGSGSGRGTGTVEGRA